MWYWKFHIPYKTRGVTNKIYSFLFVSVAQFTFHNVIHGYLWRLTFFKNLTK